MFIPAYPVPQTAVTINHVIQPPKTMSYSTNAVYDIPWLYQDIPGESLCALIEGNVFTILNRAGLLASRSQNNSFDPVYLCDLRPDAVNQHDFNKIRLFASQIVDKSDEMFFNDGMDD
jgi:hypothetical protein